MFKIAIAAGALAAALGATPAAAQYYYPYDTGCYDDWGNPVECYNYSYPFYGGPFFGFGGPFFFNGHRHFHHGFFVHHGFVNHGFVNHSIEASSAGPSWATASSVSPASFAIPA